MPISAKQTISSAIGIAGLVLLLIWISSAERNIAPTRLCSAQTSGATPFSSAPSARGWSAHDVGSSAPTRGRTGGR